MSLKLQLNDAGFIFQRFEPNEQMRSYILSLDHPTEKLESYLQQVLNSLEIPFEDFDVSFEDTTFNMGLGLHTHLIPASFQAIVWIPETPDYQGRGFMYGTKDQTSVFYPQFGDICFMKTNDLNFVHGVEPLKSKIKFRTILMSVDNFGNLGQQLTIAKSNLGPI